MDHEPSVRFTEMQISSLRVKFPNLSSHAFAMSSLPVFVPKNTTLPVPLPKKRSLHSPSSTQARRGVRSVNYGHVPMIVMSSHHGDERSRESARASGHRPQVYGSKSQPNSPTTLGFEDNLNDPQEFVNKGEREDLLSSGTLAFSTVDHNYGSSGNAFESRNEGLSETSSAKVGTEIDQREGYVTDRRQSHHARVESAHPGLEISRPLYNSNDHAFEDGFPTNQTNNNQYRDATANLPVTQPSNVQSTPAFPNRFDIRTARNYLRMDINRVAGIDAWPQRLENPGIQTQMVKQLYDAVYSLEHAQDKSGGGGGGSKQYKAIAENKVHPEAIEAYCWRLFAYVRDIHIRGSCFTKEKPPTITLATKAEVFQKWTIKVDRDEDSKTKVIQRFKNIKYALKRWKIFLKDLQDENKSKMLALAPLGMLSKKSVYRANNRQKQARLDEQKLLKREAKEATRTPAHGEAHHSDYGVQGPHSASVGQQQGTKREHASDADTDEEVPQKRIKRNHTSPSSGSRPVNQSPRHNNSRITRNVQPTKSIDRSNNYAASSSANSMRPDMWTSIESHATQSSYNPNLSQQTSSLSTKTLPGGTHGSSSTLAGVDATQVLSTHPSWLATAGSGTVDLESSDFHRRSFQTCDGIVAGGRLPPPRNHLDAAQQLAPPDAMPIVQENNHPNPHILDNNHDILAGAKDADLTPASQFDTENHESQAAFDWWLPDSSYDLDQDLFAACPYGDGDSA